jgi:putative AdoMet-dependent methyltransferase
LSTKEICRKFNISQKALRVYENKGLIHAQRDANNYHNYSVNDAVRIHAIMLMKNLGFSLNEIKKILDRNDVSVDNLYNIYLQLHVINNKIVELKKMKKNIFNIINTCFAVGEKNSDIYGILEHCSNNSYKELINRWNFDEIASNYIEKYMGHDQEYCDVMHIIADCVKKLNHGGRVIDIGVGTGNLWLSYDGKCDLTAFDNSYRMLLKAKETIPWAKVVIGDILERWDENLGVFDIVVSTYMLHHISYEKQMHVFLNLLEYCKPGGNLVFADRDFWDENGKDRLEKLLIETGKMERLENSRSEYYLYGKALTEFLTKNHYAYECRRYGDETTILIIKNH